MEYLRVYDNNKKPLDKKVLRGTPLKENEHILISLIFIENEKGEYLKKDNLLSEFDTDQKRAIAIENLGLSGAMRFKGEIDILPIDNVEIGDVYLCNDKMHVAVYTETHFVRWHELDNNLNWS